MAWIKGPRCGVDNCPSRFWTLVDGKNVCQNGHVSVGSEFAQDDEEYFTGRIIKQPRAQKDIIRSERPKLFGKRALRTYLGCLQLLVKAQSRFLVHEVGLPPELEDAIKDIWGKYMDCTQSSGHKDRKEHIGMLHTIACCQLACVQLRLPVYTFDFMKWIWRSEFPYIDARIYMDPEVLQRLPYQYWYRLCAINVPSDDRLQKALRVVISALEKYWGYNFEPVPYAPLLFRLTKEMLLPPQIATASLRIMNAIDFADNLLVLRKSGDVYADVAIGCAIIIATKLCYGLDGIKRTIEPRSPAADHPHWHVWNDILRKTWLLDDEFAGLEERSVLYMSPNDQKRYQEWFHYQFANEPWEVDASQQRLFNMFPLNERPKRTVVEGANEETIKELNAVLTETVGEDITDDTVPDVSIFPQGLPEPDAIPAGPGSLYQIYHRNDDEGYSPLPELIETLVSVMARFFGQNQSYILSVMSRVERRLRDSAVDIYDFMEMEHTLVSVAWNKRNREDVERTRHVPKGMHSFPDAASPMVPENIRSHKLFYQQRSDLFEQHRPKDVKQPMLPSRSIPFRKILEPKYVNDTVYEDEEEENGLEATIVDDELEFPAISDETSVPIETKQELSIDDEGDEANVESEEDLTHDDSLEDTQKNTESFDFLFGKAVSADIESFNKTQRQLQEQLDASIVAHEQAIREEIRLAELEPKSSTPPPLNLPKKRKRLPKAPRPRGPMKTKREPRVNPMLAELPIYEGIVVPVGLPSDWPKPPDGLIEYVPGIFGKTDAEEPRIEFGVGPLGKAYYLSKKYAYPRFRKRPGVSEIDQIVHPQSKKRKVVLADPMGDASNLTQTPEPENASVVSTTTLDSPSAKSPQPVNSANEHNTESLNPESATEQVAMADGGIKVGNTTIYPVFSPSLESLGYAPPPSSYP